MEKIVLFCAILILGLGCSSDSDEDPCHSCEGPNVSYELCDNGTGTYTLTKGNSTQTLTQADLLGLSVKEYVNILCTEEN